MHNKSIVLIIGAGQLGSRYLQGLLPIIDELSVYVIDPQNSSLERAKKIIGEDPASKSYDITYSNYIDEIDNNHIDLGIISTTSKGRADLITRVKDYFNPKFWIIEKVLEQSNNKIEQIEKVLLNSKVKAWVNNSRRTMQFHKNISKEIQNLRLSKIPLEFIYEGINWGLGCNAIHFIDLISWWLGEREFKIINIKFDNWMPSKREGFFEPFGELAVKYNDGSKLRLICKEKEYFEKENVLKIFRNNELLVEINEEKGIANFVNKKIIYGNIELQSEITSKLVKSILNNKSCELTTLDESIYQHKLLINSLSQEWSRFSKYKIIKDYAPVT